VKAKTVEVLQAAETAQASTVSRRRLRKLRQEASV